jgi:hypothetical protein
LSYKEINNAKKHAYLIIAHNKFDQLQILLNLLDDPRNDIYLHIDKKCSGFNPESISLQQAKLFVVDPISVTWGGDTLVACELVLFHAAAPGHYQYYHLLSGMDLPLKTQDEIHEFFRENHGKEFMYIDHKGCKAKTFHQWAQHYYFFGNLGFNTREKIGHGLRLIDRILAKAQKALHIYRKPIFPLYKGSQWFSITDELLQYVLSQKDAIKKQFRYTFLMDEVFLLSVAMSSPMRENIVDNCLRAIDWERGLPYTYRKEDVPMLLASQALWGRKFDQRVDAEAIEMIAAHFQKPADHI